MAVAILAGSMGWQSPAAAHPHAWVDVKVEVMFDDSGKVAGLRQTWLFDDFYTAFATEDFPRGSDGKPDQKRLDQLVEDNLLNLAPFDYFTRVTAGGTKVQLGMAAEATSRMNGARLEMTFWLPLKTPAAPDDGLEYAVFDPTYYVEMLHAEDDAAVSLTRAPPQCRYEILKPSPTIESLMLAQALDRTQTAGDGLGIHFAERVEIRCGR